MSDNLQAERRAQVQLRILRVLERAYGQLNEPILFADVNTRLEPRAELPEFRDNLEILEERGLVASVRPTLGGQKLVTITDRGRGYVAANQT